MWLWGVRVCFEWPCERKERRIDLNRGHMLSEYLCVELMKFTDYPSRIPETQR